MCYDSRLAHDVVFESQDEAERYRRAYEREPDVVCVYRQPQPTLTDAERTFLRMVRDTYAMQDDNEVCGMIAASISGLLERTR